MQRDRQSLLDIIDSIHLIFEYTQDIDWSAIAIKDRDAIFLRFIIIGEATKRLSDELRDRESEIPWRQMAGLRDVIVHEYDEINLDIIREIVELELPSILPRLQTLMSDLDRA